MKSRILIGLLILGLTQDLMANTNFLEEQLTQKSAGLNVSPALTDSKNEFFKHHALVFFFSSQCPYCRVFAPVVTTWAGTHGASILGLSFDNQPLEELPDFLPATTQWVNAAYNGKPITYPALFVVNKEHHLLYPVAFGAMSKDEFEQRIAVIQSKIEAYEARRSV